jgi:hypothetical protein
MTTQKIKRFALGLALMLGASIMSADLSVAQAEQAYPIKCSTCTNRSHLALAEYDYPGGKNWFGRKQSAIA